MFGDLYFKRKKGTRLVAGCPSDALRKPFGCCSDAYGGQSSEAALGSCVWIRSITEESVSVVTSPS